MNAKLTIVVCGKTSVRLEWKENVQRPKILDGFCFLDSMSLNNSNIISEKLGQGLSVVVFLTMQDLLGKDIKSRHKDLFKLNEDKKIDLLIIDETHFGARAEEFGKVLGTTEKKKITKAEQSNGYDESFDDLEGQIKVFSPKVKLHLSGTPYRILLDNEFENDDIVGMVQYSDIINEKEKWDRENIEKDEWENPYYGFPQMIRFAFNLNESAKAKLADLKNNGYSYDLDELFSPESTSKTDDKHNQFKNRDEVLDLLHAIDGSKEDENIFCFLNYDKIKEGRMCRHIVMVLPYCASCDAMEKLLKSEKFNNLNDYEIINIAGFDSERAMNKADYAVHVKERIEKYELDGKKTISLTVGKMLTGSTVKEWDTMIFLRNTSSPQDYDQAIFRLQSQYVKTIKNYSGKIIKHDMKPQTILVDFDPVRMYTLQHKKSLIANINKSERGNEILEENLKRELEIAPIIFMNHSKLGKVEAKDIVDTIRNYNVNKSMMDETFDIEVDQRIFEDDIIRSIIEKQPEITAKGIKFDVSAYGVDDDGDNIDVPEAQGTVESTETAGMESRSNEKTDKAQNEEDDNKKLASKLQGYYFKFLLFAFISEKDEKNISDIIEHIENDEYGKRIGKNLLINVKELKLVRDKINPQILSYLEDKIQNINQLGKEITPEKIGIALKKMSRLSVSEVVTPDKVATELINNLPDDICANSKFLDIASKTGEFANALLKKYGDEIKNNVYSIPTSGVTYECTRKIYRLLGMPVEHIYSDFTSYDLIDKTKNEKILKELENMKFDVIVGNPPYHKENTDNGRKLPMYNQFMDISFEKAPISVLITPARFLFGAGQTTENWNQKILNDKHFKVAKYEPDAIKIFPDVIEDIKGGILISLYNKNNDYGAIGIFSAYKELNTILNKVKQYKDFKSFESEISSQGVFKFTKECLKRYPEIESVSGKGTKEKIISKIVELLPDIFTETKKDDDSITFLAKGKTSRISRFISRRNIQKNNYIDTFNVLIPESNGKGAFDEFSSPVISEVGNGFADTFLAIGTFATRNEAENALKYIKTKFARAMLGVKKATQHNPKSTWTYVPLQDFTSNSDIDWSKSIAEIDRQLYAKYGLSDEEIAFIEKMIKPME